MVDARSRGPRRQRRPSVVARHGHNCVELAFRIGAGVALAAGMAGCTMQDRYESVLQANLDACDRTLSEADRARCLERVLPLSYEDYLRERAEIVRSRDAD